MPSARFELVVRIVKDDPDKMEEPKFRHVLQEIAVPIRAEFDFTSGPPPGMTPEQILAMTAAEMFEQMAQPAIDEMKKAPLGMMAFQCVQELQAKLRVKRLGSDGG